MKKTIGEILKLALPAVGEMILYMMIWVFDTIMVGRHSGQLGVSAVGLSSEVIYTFLIYWWLWGFLSPLPLLYLVL